MRGGDERDVSPEGHAAHAATLHARADESIYETRAFRVRSLKGESRYLHQRFARLSSTDIIQHYVFLFLLL